MSSATASNIARACAVFCEGPILHYVQTSGIFNDSKTFVDMPLKYSPENVTAAFYDIPDPTDKAALENFLNTYFEPAGSDLDTWEPEDLQTHPPFLDNVVTEYKQWADDLNQLWKLLGRQVNASVHEAPERHTFLPRRYPMIVPGGRFRESYYWDSWWIVRGLLVCDMPTTAEYVLRNLLDDVANGDIGFVPNGGRIYYLDRSQPPLLAEMAVSIIEYYGWSSSEGVDLLEEVYPILQQEYAWWMSPDSGHVVNITLPSEDITGSVLLNHYFSNASSPRPESYREDLETATGLRTSEELQASNWSTPTSWERALYRNIRAGAETGWDFSSRWLMQGQDLSTDVEGVEDAYSLRSIVTSHIIPTELNTVLFRYEGHLSSMAGALNQEADAVMYQDAAAKRKYGINSLMWNATTSRWNDLNVSTTTQTLGYDRYVMNGSAVMPVLDDSNGVSVSSYLPLWGELFPSSSEDEASVEGQAEREAVLTSLTDSGLIQIGGILTTTVTSGQQWDSPNAWPPLVLLLVEGIRTLQVNEALQLADNITSNWLRTCFLAYNETGYMYEKYNAFEVGVGGGGGEYVPQKGFGWSNGVALSLLQYTGTANDSIDTDDDEMSLTLKILVLIVICATAGVLVAIGFYMFRYFRKGSRGYNKHDPESDQNITMNRDHVKNSLI